MRPKGKNKIFSNSIGMEIKEKPPDKFSNVLKYHWNTH